jgi:hypothetical protein
VAAACIKWGAEYLTDGNIEGRHSPVKKPDLRSCLPFEKKKIALLQISYRATRGALGAQLVLKEELALCAVLLELARCVLKYIFFALRAMYSNKKLTPPEQLLWIKFIHCHWRSDRSRDGRPGNPGLVCGAFCYLCCLRCLVWRERAGTRGEWGAKTCFLWSSEAPLT